MSVIKGVRGEDLVGHFLLVKLGKLITDCMTKWEGWPLGHTYNITKALHVNVVRGLSLGHTYNV